MWHGYFVVERQNISDQNWAQLRELFDAMGTHGSLMPAHNTHKRERLDGDAMIYESLFDPSEVSQAQFKQLLADEFAVDIDDIEVVTSSEDYAGISSTVWQYRYPIAGQDRFKVIRFAGGGAWELSRRACVGYLELNGWNGLS